MANSVRILTKGTVDMIKIIKTYPAEEGRGGRRRRRRPWPGLAPHSAAAGLPRHHDDLPQLVVDLHADVLLRPRSGELSERAF